VESPSIDNETAKSLHIVTQMYLNPNLNRNTGQIINLCYLQAIFLLVCHCTAVLAGPLSIFCCTRVLQFKQFFQKILNIKLQSQNAVKSAHSINQSATQPFSICLGFRLYYDNIKI